LGCAVDIGFFDRLVATTKESFAQVREKRTGAVLERSDERVQRTERPLFGISGRLAFWDVFASDFLDRAFFAKFGGLLDLALALDLCSVLGFGTFGRGRRGLGFVFFALCFFALFDKVLAQRIADVGGDVTSGGWDFL